MIWSQKQFTDRILEGKTLLESRKCSTTRPRTSSSGTEGNKKAEAEGKNPCFISGHKCENNKSKCDLRHSSIPQSLSSSEREACSLGPSC